MPFFSPGASGVFLDDSHPHLYLSLSFCCCEKMVAISLKVKTSINTRDQKKVHHRLLFTAVLFLHVHQGGRNDDKNARDEDTDGQCHAKFINVHNEN